MGGGYELRDIDKLTEMFSIRIPEVLKTEIDRLSVQARKDLNDAVLIAMTKVVHLSKFDPNDYLKSTPQ